MGYKSLRLSVCLSVCVCACVCVTHARLRRACDRAETWWEGRPHPRVRPPLGERGGRGRPPRPQAKNCPKLHFLPCSSDIHRWIGMKLGRRVKLPPGTSSTRWAGWAWPEGMATGSAHKQKTTQNYNTGVKLGGRVGFTPRHVLH